jgi:Asp-tRNA(Asn)/Glu-tRNA(Gln) amidotransferase A subunit family amidase
VSERNGVRAIAESVATGERSAREVCEERIARAEAHADLGAFWHLDEEAALAEADAIDARRAAGERLGPLAGVPVAVKDAFAVRGMPSGGGPPATTPSRDAAAVARVRSAGGIILGKTAMHQLGWGMTGQTPGYPVCRNPLDSDRQPGGSSSGSAVAVAAEIVPLSLGGDTGGSVRQPAAWCRVVGWKPQQSAVQREGLAPLAPCMDTVGWFTDSAADAAYVHRAIAAGRYPPARGITGASFAVDPIVLERADPVVAEAVEAAATLLTEAGLQRRDDAMPGLPARLGPIYAAHLAEHWGDVVDADPESFGTDVRDGVAAGRAVAAVDYLDTLADRTAQRDQRWRGADLVVGPTTPVLPPLLSEPDDVRRVGGLTRPYNLLDWPAISLPAPGPAAVGIQIAGPRGSERLIFDVATALEAARALEAR